MDNTNTNWTPDVKDRITMRLLGMNKNAFYQPTEAEQQRIAIQQLPVPTRVLIKCAAGDPSLLIGLVKIAGCCKKKASNSSTKTIKL